MSALHLRAALLTAVLAASSACANAAAAPSFVPSPSSVYEGFTAINGPRAEVPVGALWIDGYGPHGDPASADNLETVRGLTGVTIARDLELRLTAGLLDVLGIDPGLRKHFQARFTDLSVVKVKDVSKLTGPSGEPRIIEALKAGSILITNDGEVSLDLDRSSVTSPFTARLDSGSKRGSAIEGRDMFIAFRIAALKLSKSEPELVRFDREGEVLTTVHNGLVLSLRPQPCDGKIEATCSTSAKWHASRIGIDAPEANYTSDGRMTLTLPRADGRGGLYTSVELAPVAPCKLVKARGCGSEWRAWFNFVGERTEASTRPSAPRW